MKQPDGKNLRGLKIAKSIVALAAAALLGFSVCSRNNSLDPKAGDYEQGTNLLHDPGFEMSDTSVWKMGISGGRSMVNTGAQSGTMCEQMALFLPYPRAVWQDVPVSAGKVYSVSGWIKTDNVSTSAHILVLWYNTITPPENQSPPLPSDHRFIKADTLGRLTGNNGWTAFSRNYYAPASALTAQLYLECVPDSVIGNGTACFDNMAFAVH
jgi:hypothetical protein